MVVDEVVLVKGRVDHKEAGTTCLVVQSLERFAPSAEELERARKQADLRAREAAASAQPVYLRVDAGSLDDGAIDELRRAIEDAPGSAEVVLDVGTSAGVRRLRFGEAFRVCNTSSLRSELEQALASARLAVA